MKKILMISILLFLLTSCGNNVVEKMEETAIPINNEVVEEVQIEENKIDEVIEENKGEEAAIENEMLEIFVSMEEVEKHNNNGDCYTVLDGKVYDVSSFFGTHPGGDDNLSKTCGIDATELFEGQHGNNAKAQMKKDDFYIGELEK